jgi:cytochrome c-type biogenesis protein CcmH
MMISVFWIFALLLVAAAIALLVIPLLRKARPARDEGIDALVVLRDQKRELDREVAAGRMTADERELRVAELSRRVVEEGLTEPQAAAAAGPSQRRGLAIALCVLIPVVAFAGYLVIGTPAALDPSTRAIVAKSAGHGDITPAQFREMLAELRARLDKNPNDATGWKMLAGGLRYIQDFAGAAEAYRRATDLVPTDAAAFADYADALAMAQDRNLEGKPTELIQKALALDPKQPKALALAGTIEIEKGNKAGARAYYERLLATVPPDSEQASEVRSIIAEIDGVPPPSLAAAPAMPGTAPMLAQQDAKAPAVAAPVNPHKTSPTAGSPAAAAAPASADPAKALTGTVTLASAVASGAKPDDVVYIFARAAQGPRMPLAILRHKVSDLPLKFRLDDSNGMAGGPALSAASAVKIEARISKTGDAIPKPGDLRGESAVVAPGASGLSIVIDQVVR